MSAPARERAYMTKMRVERYRALRLLCRRRADEADVVERRAVFRR